MSASWAPFGYEFVTAYDYTDEHGRYLFEKRRYRSTLPGTRNKTFLYFDRTNRSSPYSKPSDADRWLYRLPAVLEAVQAGETIHWAEGEKDADALWAAGVPATSIHQGAAKCTPEQAAWLRDARRVVIWVDKDEGHWEVGAYDAALRHDLLADAGVRPTHIRLVKARGRGKDAYDHLQLYPPERAIRVDKARLAAVAALYTPLTGRKLGYRNV
ncbi:hypothetical protein [Curtobacterium sp. VKM Ac-2884]|uniref:hypothetical protein n=1 Tax=Curtobacterium sp. VKM Ac-2884 TaxID=2783818 RepID=UPI00188BF325|nr:hypothetical protein [Curtobacterium sp. VKM Ac-2884]MBF4604710.1 hypothetical protein [Curtobacterium sp. VKM Ac-2884]